MKKYFFILNGIILNCSLNAQTVIPQTIPCLTVTQTNLPGLGSGIEAIDCIETDGNVTFLQYENYSIKAGEYIEFGQNTVINPDASHQFHAYIDNGGMDVAWYYPNATPGTVGQFEKLELGVEFRDDIDALIGNFTASPQTTPNLNPFNPEQVDLYAEFWWYNDGSIPLTPVGWYGPQKINGFYYEEYERGSTNWTLQPNQHDFRIRFAPRRTGLWRCKITAVVQGFGTFTATEFTFNCVDSNSKDFMRVGDNGRYFRIGDEPFFPVGHNVVWPQGSSTEPWDRGFNPIVPPSFFESYHLQMSDIKNNGGNYMRFINNPWSTDCEFEKLNDYSDRMRHSWELDKILEHAEVIDLKIHFNLQIQYSFDAPDGFGANHWDWSAYGDPYYDGTSCVVFSDQGYCYRSELGIVEPIDFFTNADAKKFYKYKLRYLIARYGYSNEIALIELFSEINNAGSKHTMELIDGGCYPNPNLTIKPYDTYQPDVPFIMGEWQNEMAMYIKTELQHTNHPLAVSYGGAPEYDYDQSYASEYIDVNTYNAYQVLIEKHALNVAEVTGLTEDYDKPFMFSEYGPGDATFTCDQGNLFIKSLVLSPFSGTAGAAMNWEYQSTDEHFLWHHMGPVNELMSGIKLDEENWVAMSPIVSSNKAVEILYLRNFVTDNYRAVGAVSNRTYNYYTQGIGTPCVPIDLPDELELNIIYQLPQDFEQPIGTETLIIPNMGEEVEYKINWYNALTGDFLGTGQNSSLANGNFPLLFPLVSGDETRPILFFEIYKSDESTFKSTLMDTLISENEILPMKSDSKVESIVVTDWIENDIKINITPNPTAEIINVNVESTLNFTWSLYNLIGDQIIKGEILNRNAVIDITNYPSGLYLLKLSDGTKEYIFKIVKS